MKHIKINEEVKENIIENFKKYLDTTKFTGANINYTAALNNTIDKTQFPKAKLYISAIAYLKMMLYVRDTSTEIAWHGTVKKHGKNIFQITDVMLYPQTVTGTTVTTEQDKYNEWIQNLDDDTHNSMRFQGHSHVNMATTPSGTDITFYNDILQVLPNNDYYIFMIMNKQGSMTLLIYDLAENIIYENEDIEYSIVNDTQTQPLENGFTEILEDIAIQKEDYCKTYTYPNTYPNYGQNYSLYGNKLFDTQTSAQPTRKTYSFYDNKSNLDINDMLDDIDKKFKNTTLISKKDKRSKK